MHREHSEPGAIDRGRERVVVEHRDGAEIGQRLHADKRDSRCDPRPRHRQRHAPTGRSATQAQRLRSFESATSLRQKCAAREQINVRIQRQRQHEHHAAGRTYRRQPARCAERLAQPALQRAGVVEKTDRDEGQHVGRNGQRQQQRPIEEATARETHRSRSARRAPCRWRRSTIATPTTSMSVLSATSGNT